MAQLSWIPRLTKAIGRTIDPDNVIRMTDPEAMGVGGELRNLVAQRNAERMLGLRADNTAAERAAAMEYALDDPVFHYSSSEEPFDVFRTQNKVGVPRQDIMGAHVGTPRATRERFYTQMTGRLPRHNDFGVVMRGRDWEVPERYTKYDPETVGFTMPLVRRRGREFTGTEAEPWTERELGDFLDLGGRKDTLNLREHLAEKGYTDIPYFNAIEDPESVSRIMLIDRPEGSPAVLRSLFAAFDPAAADSPNLLRAGVPLTLTPSIFQDDEQ